MMELEEVCLMCEIPRKFYLYKAEPGISNPDFTMPKSCIIGHFWVGIGVIRYDKN